MVTLADHKDAVVGLRWCSWNSSQVISASWDHCIVLWDLQLAGEVSRIRGSKAFTSIDVNKKSGLVISSNTDAVPRLYDCRSHDGSLVKQSFIGHNGWVSCVRWSPRDEMCFVSASFDKSLKMWDIRSSKTSLFDLHGHEDRILCCAWGDDLVASGSADSTIKKRWARDSKISCPKKDFHPSAWWNLKRVWEVRQKKAIDDKRQEDLRVQYEKEQEMLNNKALLGDEKAKMGLSFMYDAPAGMTKREEPKEEPKFEWQRKYQAPREEWAKDNDQIQDQPFGIQVRNVRCCKCHKWGHLNTDNECPLYGMSGNFEDEGYANNPSDLIKELRKEREACGPSRAKEDRINKKEFADRTQLAEEMKETHGLRLKGSVLNVIREDQEVSTLKAEPSEADQMKAFLASLSDKEKKKLMKKLLGSGKNGKDDKKHKKNKKKKAKKEKRKHEAKSEKEVRGVVKVEPSSAEESDRESSSKNEGRRRDSPTVEEKTSRRDKRERSSVERRALQSGEQDAVNKHRNDSGKKSEQISSSDE
ncbi:hypothetical protein KIN20_028197, partial [Parelaphostrongylus tenuis]